MNPSSSEQSAAVVELNQLFVAGAEKGLWENNKAACGRVIGVERRDMSRLLHGHRSDEEVMPVLQKMRDMVHSGVPSEVLDQQESESEEEQVEAQTEFDRFYQLGLQNGKWKTMKECGEVLDISYDSVRNFRNTNPATFDSVRTKNFYDAIMQKLKRLFPQQRKHKEESAQKSAEATTTTPAAGSLAGQADLAALISHPAIARIDDLEAKLPGMIQSALAQSGRDEQAVPGGVIPSKWADEIVSGRMEIKNQQMGNLRFVVTAETFRKLLSKPLSREEIGDTNALAEISANADTELRRRLEALHQMEESPQRAEAIKALVSSLSERIRQAVALAITIEKIRECDVDKGLIRAARHFDSLSDIFNK
jgi:hypothetical protein